MLTTPIGALWSVMLDGQLARLAFEEPSTSTDVAHIDAQLAAYFDGSRRSFDIDLAPAGTEFQQRVWATLATIPYGETRSYAWLADKVGSVPRAVGSANGANPIPIIVPCHRVIGADGSLTGYSGGLRRKRWLLDHESRQPSLFGT